MKRSGNKLFQRWKTKDNQDILSDKTCLHKIGARVQIHNQKIESWIAVSTLIAFALLYSLSALLAPFWSGNDTWSNLLPIIHFRHSILEQHSLPLFTNLWYGGRAQVANPLWSFLYLPSTLIWLITSLDWGARIIFFGHLIFSLLIGRKLAGLFLDTEVERIPSAVLLSSPIFPALIAGHMEKVMSWGWVLMALFFLLNENLTFSRRGLGSGICMGIIPLTGANYYALYTEILLVPLVFSYKNRKLLGLFFLGSLIGILHLPNVLYMVGQARRHADFYIDMYSVDSWGVLSALSIGFTEPMGWETWAAIGIPMICLFGLIVAKTARLLLQGKDSISPQNQVLLLSVTLLFLLATGIAYRGNHLFDLFRVPARALAFIALGFVLYILMNLKAMRTNGFLKQSDMRLFIVASAVQVAAIAWLIRPQGSAYSPYEKSVQHLANILKADNAKSVWLATNNWNDMYIEVGLTRNNIALPRVYYGDMGQEIQIKGNHCGYSFDHVLTFAPVEGDIYELNAELEWSDARGEIPLSKLSFVEQVPIHGAMISVYRVGCNQ